LSRLIPRRIAPKQPYLRSAITARKKIRALINVQADGPRRLRAIHDIKPLRFEIILKRWPVGFMKLGICIHASSIQARFLPVSTNRDECTPEHPVLPVHVFSEDEFAGCASINVYATKKL
jgi:hypothetical protein